MLQAAKVRRAQLLATLICCTHLNLQGYGAEDSDNFNKWFTGSPSEKELHMLAYAVYMQSTQYPEVTVNKFIEVIPENAPIEVRHALLSLIKSGKWEIGTRANIIANDLVEAYIKADKDASLAELLTPSNGDVLAIALLHKMIARENSSIDQIMSALLSSSGDLNLKKNLLWVHTVAHYLANINGQLLSDENIVKLENAGNDLPKYLAFVYNNLKGRNNSLEYANYFMKKYGEGPEFANYFLAREVVANERYSEVVNSMIMKILASATSVKSETILYLTLKRVDLIKNKGAINWLKLIANRDVSLPDKVKITDSPADFSIVYHMLLNKTKARHILESNP